MEIVGYVAFWNAVKVGTLMLEEAIPAALLALALEGLFELAERVIARRG
jgi:ABC-type proline/glycine betaine transport system permease subunit